MEYFFSRQKYFSLLLMFVWTIFIVFFTKLYLSCSEVHYTTPQQIEKCEEQIPTDDNIHGFLIPSDEVLSRADDEQLADIYWRYVNTIQALCYNQTRLGSLKDGGKEICMDDEYKLKMPCIVYSFGYGRTQQASETSPLRQGPLQGTMVANVKVFVNKDRRVTLQEVANQLSIGKASEHQILHEKNR